MTARRCCLHSPWSARPSGAGRWPRSSTGPASGSPWAGDALDTLRYGLWLAFLIALIRPGGGKVDKRRRGRGLVVAASVLVAVRLLSSLAVQIAASGAPIATMRIVSRVALAVLGLFLVEQLFRNLGEDSKWNAKPVCIGLACTFAYDLFVYSEAQLFGRFDSDALSIRGLNPRRLGALALRRLATPGQTGSAGCSCRARQRLLGQSDPGRSVPAGGVGPGYYVRQFSVANGARAAAGDSWSQPSYF